VLHRDIKPHNILIDQDCRPRIVDFGLAKDVRIEGITEAGQVSGTLHYMSPEQAQARTDELDARTDVYSLGVVLYEMLTLRRPFEATTDSELVRKVLNSRPRPPHHLDERIPKALSAICMRALQKSREGRYEDADEFLQDLRTFLAGRSIALGARLRFEDAYRYVFVKRPWIGVVGLVLVFGTAMVLAPKALTTVEAHAANPIEPLKDPSQRLSALFAPQPGETPAQEEARIRAMLEVAQKIRDHTPDTSSGKK
jgi:serine/threonine protein kinase